MNTLPVKLPRDDAGAKLMRFEGIRGQRYTEIFLIDADQSTGQLIGGVYNTVGLNDPDGTGDTTPQAVLDGIDLDALKQEYGVLGAFKNGPRLWCLDWAEAMAGKDRDFTGLEARWVMWLNVPRELVTHESVAYKATTGKRDTRLGVNAGSLVFLLDDPDGNTYCMKSASLIVDPGQTYDSLQDLGGRLEPAAGWKFRTEVLQEDLVLTPGDGGVIITQDELGNTYDRVGGAYSNYTP
jgi:hypothetical protein